MKLFTYRKPTFLFGGHPIAFVLFFALLLLCSLTGFAQVAEVWEVNYTDPTTFQNMVSDKEGNVYITGTSAGISGTDYDDSDYMTAKFNSSGEQEWVARYNGPRNDKDQPSSIAVDREGNVFVTGRSFGATSNFDYATIKYNAAGEQQWVRRHNGVRNGHDEAQSIAVDAEGKVYVTGIGDYSIFSTVCYDASGQEQWVSKYQGPVGNSIGLSVAVDAEGNVYVAGDSGGESGDDFATIKYNASGQQQWVARYNNLASAHDFVKSLKVDGEGNVYVTGTSLRTGTGDDFTTVKYNTSGVEQWVRTYDGPASGDDWVDAMGLDDEGNIFVAGRSQGNGTGEDYTLIKYNTLGEQQWVKRHNGPDSGDDNLADMVLDGQGKIYVTGSAGTIKYNTLGEQLWAIEGGASIGLDEDSFVYLTGGSGIRKYTQQLNIAPTAVDDAFATDEGGMLTVEAPGVLSNDTDPDNEALTALPVSGPANGELNLGPDGSFTYTPVADFNGIDSFSYKASDGTEDSNIATVTITVNPVNVPPVLSLPALPASVEELSPFTFTASATDEDNDELIFSLAEAPEGAVIDPSTGVFSWIPTEAQGDGSSYSFTVEVSDGTDTSNESFTLVVSEVNSAPELVTIPEQEGDELSLISFTATASDADLPANSLSYYLLNASEGASIDPVTGVFSWVPGEDQDGTHSFTVKVTDSGEPAMSAEQVVSVRVNEVNKAPVLDPLSHVTTTCGNPVSFTATANDEDMVGGAANTLSFSLEGEVPQGVAIDENTGEFNWSPSSEQLGSHEITIRVSDNGSPVLYDEQTITLTLEDEEPPTVKVRQISVQLNARGTASITAAELDNGSSDNCTPAEELVMQLDKTSFSCEDVGQNTLRLTVEDASGNSAFSEVIVVVEDTIKPEVVVQEVTLMLDASGKATLSVGEVDNGSSDNCSISSLTLDKDSFSCEELGENTVTLTAMDASGNTASATAIVRVTDAMPPIARAQDLTIYLDGDQASLTAEQLDDGSSDNCSIASLSLDKTAFSCNEVGENTLTLTVTDDIGNSATVTATVTVVDRTPPTITAPAAITVSNDTDECSAVVALESATATDNCSYTISNDAPAENIFPIGTTTVTWTATDASGNTATALQQVIVEDREAPTITAMEDISLTTDAGECGAVVTYSLPDFADNCSGADIAQTDRSGLSSGEVFPVGITTLAYTVTDGAGNSASIEFKVTVRDEEVPQVTAPTALQRATDAGECSAVVNLAAPEASDNCGIAAVENDAPAGNVFPVGITTVNWSISDLHGNTTTISQEVRVEDEEVPVVQTRDITVQLDAAGNATVSAADIDNGSGDNCGIASMVLDRTSFSCADIGDNRVALTVNDSNGNTSTGSAIVTVSDIIAPSIGAGQVFNVDEKSTTGTIVGNVEASDNCSLQDFRISGGDEAAVFAIDAAGVITVNNAAGLDYETTPEFTLTIVTTDQSGNGAVREVSVQLNNVNDKAPVVAFLPDMTAMEHELITFTATASAEDEAAGELRFSLAEEAPEGAFIDPVTGEFSWTPSEGQGPAAHNIRVVVSDGALTDSEELVIWVEEVNEAPVFTSKPEVVAREGELYTYQLTATDADLPANTLTYEALEIPSWLSFDAATQTLSGTPERGVEESSLIRLQLSDGEAVVIQEFTLTVEVPTGLFGSRKQQEDPQIFAYPNPTKGYLTINVDEVTAKEKITVSLFTLEGKLLLQNTGNLRQGEERLNNFLQNAKAGTYLLRIKGKTQAKTLKIEKL